MEGVSGGRGCCHGEAVHTKCIRNQRSNSQFNFDPPDGVKNILLGRFPPPSSPHHCSFHSEMLVSREKDIFFYRERDDKNRKTRDMYIYVYIEQVFV